MNQALYAHMNNKRKKKLSIKGKKKKELYQTDSLNSMLPQYKNGQERKKSVNFLEEYCCRILNKILAN
jgi:hypothetical protein